MKSRIKARGSDQRAALEKAAAAPVAAKRTRGDGEGTRERILQVAITEFARLGYAGARVEQITKLAKINDRMLYYYFQSKEKLFIEVLEAVYGDLREFEESLSIRELPPIEAVRALIDGMWSYYQSHPEFISLVSNENLLLATHLKRSTRALSLALPIVSILKELLARGAEQKVFRNGVDPLQFYIALAGLNYFYLSNQHTLSAVLSTDLGTGAARHRWQHAMEEFVLRFLLVDPHTTDVVLEKSHRRRNEELKRPVS